MVAKERDEKDNFVNKLSKLVVETKRPKNKNTNL